MGWMLRPATIDDLDAIMALETSTFGSDAWSRPVMRSDMGSRHTVYLVAAAEGSDAVVGYAGLHAPVGSGDGDIQTIAVAESVRHQGIGRMLMVSLLTTARERDARHVFLEVRADNPNAQALYESLGFEQIAVRPRYYQPDGVDAHVMKAVLS
jgi:ribosomal-protein-alanine N-acetyltransferase